MWCDFGSDLIVLLFNKNAHLGAVSLADFDDRSGRAWASVISSVGHREDSIAHRESIRISRQLKRRVCVIAGIHLQDPTEPELEEIIENCRKAVDQVLGGSEDKLAQL